MRRTTRIATAMAALATVTVLAVDQRGGEDGERAQWSMRFSGPGPHSLEVDTVWGSIDVAVHDAPTVEVVSRRRTRADSEAARRQAGREVTLQVTDNAPALRLYVDGPFRQPWRERRREGWRDPGYEVQYDFTIRVPRDVHLRLRTVNDGHVRVEGTRGAFDVANVNGPIDLVDIGGAGTARTVNGHVHASFSTNPRDPVGLTTLNGDVVARFARALSADLWLKTVHGGMFTDFDTTPIRAPAPAVEQHGSRRVWRMPEAGARVGTGGPSLRFETFNGDIRILRGQS